MRKEVEQLALMGAMPDETDEPTDVLIDKYADLLGKITKPITLDEAHILIKLFPPTALYGIEWTLLHLIESVYPETGFVRYLLLKYGFEGRFDTITGRQLSL